MDTTPEPVLIAVIGGGPRALYLLEQIAEHCRHRPDLPVHVVVCEAGMPGAGRVYDPRQPRVLRLNAPASIVATAMGDLPSWLAENYPEYASLAVGDEVSRFYPPRAVVGEFLHESWKNLLAHKPETMRITHIDRRVDHINDGGDSPWEITFTGDAPRAGTLPDFTDPGDEIVIMGADIVVLATGHESWWEGIVEDALHPYIPGSLDVITPGSAVSVRGLALTFIDTCLLLTEGRGGRFNTETLPWRYELSGKEPARIAGFSRSGRLMQVKPAPDSKLENLRPECFESCAQQLREAADVDGIKQAIAELAVALLAEAGVVVDSACSSRVWSILNGADQVEDAWLEFEESLQVARGEVPPGAPWAVSKAFRMLFDALRERANYCQLDGVMELCATLERVAFGPPLTTAERLYALVNAGIVVRPQGGGEPDASDFMVDAVVSPPGVQQDSLLARMALLGYVRVDSSRVLQVEDDGELTGCPGAYVVGRAAEGMLIGHDSLNRDLHEEVKRCAAAVMGRVEATMLGRQ